MSKAKYGKYCMCKYLLLTASVDLFFALSSMTSLEVFLHPIFSVVERTSPFHGLMPADNGTGSRNA